MDFDTVDNYTSTVEYHHLSLHHGDLVKSTLRVTNGAQESIQSVTNGVVVDLTPPVMTTMWDGNGGSDIQYTVWSPKAMLLFFIPELGKST